MGGAWLENPGKALPIIFPDKAERQANCRAATERKGGDGARSGIVLRSEGGAMPTEKKRDPALPSNIA